MSVLRPNWPRLYDVKFIFSRSIVDYPSGFSLVTLIILLAAWFVAYRWLRRYERGEVS